MIDTIQLFPAWVYIDRPAFVDVETELRSYDEDMDILFYNWKWAAVELPGVDDHYWNEYRKLQAAQNSIIEGHCIAVAAGL